MMPAAISSFAANTVARRRDHSLQPLHAELIGRVVFVVEMVDVAGGDFVAALAA